MGLCSLTATLQHIAGCCKRGPHTDRRTCLLSGLFAGAFLLLLARFAGAQPFAHVSRPGCPEGCGRGRCWHCVFLHLPSGHFAGYTLPRRAYHFASRFLIALLMSICWSLTLAHAATCFNPRARVGRLLIWLLLASSHEKPRFQCCS
jgi:hypothetical protein